MAEKNNSFERIDNQIIHKRWLKAPRNLVWEVWTQPEHIYNWWGPEGYTLKHKSMEVKPNAVWEFTMHGFGMDYNNKIEYLQVEKPALLVYRHGNGSDDNNFTVYVTFEEHDNDTLLTMRSVFKSAAFLDMLIEKVNAIEGGKQTLNKLEAYVNAQIKLRQQNKTKTMARVSTYLNFPNYTETAFLFYQSVFGGEFSGMGIQRFGNLPPDPNAPALSEEDKNLILHIELEIVGGHVLMGTDAPESMGFTVVKGNNVHINLDLDSRAETERIFNALSAGGKVSMELQDMFWGAYFGSFTDRFGINWMVNCNTKN